MFSFRTIVAGCAALALAGCVHAEAPLLDEARPILGSVTELHLYPVNGPDETLRFTGASEGGRRFASITLRWDGKRYVPVSAAGMSSTARLNYAAFTVHELENGDHIVQAFDDNAGVEYWPLRRLHDGVYFASFVDAADPAYRAIFPTCRVRYSCTIETREQLVALARAAAANPSLGTGFLVIRTGPRGQ